MLEAKDQGCKRKCSPKKKKRSSQKFFRRSPKKKKKGLHKNFSSDLHKNVFQKIFQALHKILTIQKIVLSSARGQANFRGLEASRPRTSKCVLEDVLEAKDVLEDSTSDVLALVWSALQGCRFRDRSRSRDRFFCGLSLGLGFFIPASVLVSNLGGLGLIP